MQAQGLSLHIGSVQNILRRSVDELCGEFDRHALQYQRGGDNLAKELSVAGDRYRQQASEALKLIEGEEFTLRDLKHVTDTLYMTSLLLRWALEQHTTTYRKILAKNPAVSQALENARRRVDAGELDEGFADMLALVRQNRDFYPLLMSMGFFYLRHKGNLPYAMKYFEKAAISPPAIERKHYRVLALQFLANCEESQKHYKNALSVLQRAETRLPEDPSLRYSLARMHGYLGQDQYALEDLHKALRTHPAFFSMALIDPAFGSIRAPLERSLRQHKKTFQELGKRFDKLVSRIVELFEEKQLGEFSPALGREMDRVAQALLLVCGGHYFGIRKGINTFYHAHFPEVVQMMSTTMSRKAKRDRKTAEHRRFRNRRRLRTASWLLTLPAMGAAAVATWLYQAPALKLSPVSFTGMEFVLPALAALLAVFLVRKFLSLFKRNEKKAFRSADKLEHTSVQVDQLEKNLGNFWLNEVAPHVDSVPVWTKAGSKVGMRTSRVSGQFS